MNRSTGSAEAGKRQLDQLLLDALQHQAAGLFEEAKNLYLQILAIDVRHAPSLFGLGSVAQQARNYDVAAKMMLRAIAVDDSVFDYHFGLGVALQSLGEFDAALAAFGRAADLAPENLLARFRIGNVLQLQGQLDDAVSAYEAILAVKPDSLEAEFNIGNVLRLQGKLNAARARYHRALKRQPKHADALWNLSLLDLLEGDYAAGWRTYESRQQRPTPNLRHFPKPQWKGEPLNGARILLHAEQGLGDTLQFLRYVSMVVARGGQVILDVPKEIQRLAAEIPGTFAVIATGGSIPEFEWQCPLMSLPLAFGTTLESIPAAVPYLIVPDEAKRTADCLTWPEQGLRIGLVWGATPRSFEDSDRSIPSSLFDPVLATPDAHFYSLQLGPQANQFDPHSSAMMDLREAIEDFADTAALVEHLDLVVTVDTSVAHLAGALGKPTWVLLPFAPDWRWLTARDDSPWYPTVRLFRQPRPRDWQSVLERVQTELSQLVRKSAKPE